MDLIFFRPDMQKLPTHWKKEAKDWVYCAEFKGNEPLLKESKFPLAHLVTKPNAKEVQRLKGKVHYIAVQGGSISMNRFAVSTRGVDFLLSPASKGAFAFDTAMARLARENNTRLLIPLWDVHREHGFDQAMLLKNLFMTLKIAHHYRVSVSVVSGARSLREVRSEADRSAATRFLSSVQPYPVNAYPAGG